MLFISITRPESLQNISNVVGLDGIELRLDLFPHWNLAAIEQILSTSIHPIMLTLRKSSHGGKFLDSEEEREAKILELLKLKPPFMDLEYDMRKDFLEKVLHAHPKTKFILSYHNFQNTPDNLSEIFHSMAFYPAYQYKIATMALSTNDALRMLLFAQEHSQISAICMGEKGEFARVLGPAVGNLINYANLEKKEQTAPGQLSISELVNSYRFPSLNEKTALYGLIGDPVANSQGHLYHNAVFAKCHLNAVYVKMSVKAEELTAFFPMAKKIGFKGLSVTMPLKEKVLPFLDDIDPKALPIGAINTLLFKKGRIFGTNTDGVGALDAIEKRGPVRNKKLILLGAGGAARAIAAEAYFRGADVLILNRTIEKACELAALFDCRAGGLSEVPSDYDILINCSPNPMPIDPDKILPKALVMDIVCFPKETPFIQKARDLGCPTIYGEEMFLNQAAAQTKLWIDNK